MKDSRRTLFFCSSRGPIIGDLSESQLGRRCRSYVTPRQCAPARRLTSVVSRPSGQIGPFATKRFLVDVECDGATSCHCDYRSVIHMLMTAVR